MLFRSLSIKNYTHTHIYIQYQLMQSLIGAGQMDINDLINHTGARRGDITITITSPHGTVSLLLPTRERDFVNAEELSWSFLSVLHWGEDPRGEWVVLVEFQSNEGYVQLKDLNVTFYGIASSAEAVSRDCSLECKGGCAAIGIAYCDACQLYRSAETLDCMDNCTEEFELHHSYCIQASADDDRITNSSLPMPTPTALYPINTTAFSVTTEAFVMSSYNELPLSPSNSNTSAGIASTPLELTITYPQAEEIQLVPTSSLTSIPSPSPSLLMFTPSHSYHYSPSPPLLSPSPPLSHSIKNTHVTGLLQSNIHAPSLSTFLSTFPPTVLSASFQTSHTPHISPTQIGRAHV